MERERDKNWKEVGGRGGREGGWRTKVEERERREREVGMKPLNCTDLSMDSKLNS